MAPPGLASLGPGREGHAFQRTDTHGAPPPADRCVGHGGRWRHGGGQRRLAMAHRAPVHLATRHQNTARACWPTVQASGAQCYFGCAGLDACITSGDTFCRKSAIFLAGSSRNLGRLMHRPCGRCRENWSVLGRVIKSVIPIFQSRMALPLGKAQSGNQCCERRTFLSQLGRRQLSPGEPEDSSPCSSQGGIDSGRGHFVHLGQQTETAWRKMSFSQFHDIHADAGRPELAYGAGH